MEIETIALKRINPAPYNPRTDLQPGDPDYERLRRSIEEFGYVEPLVWNRRTGNLVGGHQRLKVLLAQGAKKVEVSVVDLPLEKEKALNVALNKISGDWDQLKLAHLLDELSKVPDLDFELTGFDLPEAQELIADVIGSGDDNSEENFDIAAALDTTKPAVTKRGELLEMGSHRLLCGDATNADDVRRLMDGEKAILFATDPPYLVNYDGTNRPSSGKGKPPKRRAVKWDNPDNNPQLYEEFCAVAVAEAIAPNTAWLCWHASVRQAMVEAAWIKAGAFVHQQLIWAKDRPIPGHSWYSWQHEPCLFGWVRPNKPPRGRDEHLSTIWQVPTASGGAGGEHPTSKPVELFCIPMRQHTRRGDLCYEPFCGSSSQLIAADKLGRRCFALEIDLHYCDVIVRRWIAFVGERNAPADLVRRYRLKGVRR